MSWHFPLFLVVTVTLPSVCLQFNPQPLEELGSDIGIQVFHQIVKSRPQDNIVISPHGIASVLGMLQLGADGRTKAQLTSVMRYGVKGAGKTLKKINKAIVSKKNKDIVTVANAMFVKNGSKIEVPFITRNKDVFQCEVRNVNFKDPATACDSINAWVKNETRGKIDNLLSPDLIDGVLTSMMVPKRVQVVLPKFTATAEMDLKEPLKVLGITEMFDPSKANFAKITRSENLHVSHILQKAKIEVSEDGTKASAVTTAILIARSSPPWFIVDRPFLFFIRHNPTGAFLFMGQINKP
uniref:Serpin family E member 2 n=1 Tax=Myotis myotis TaxID=51298 RepID=A0A7J7WJ81_MYOMY|nr:serpin family E member 2 [Myotis myotis]